MKKTQIEKAIEQLQAEIAEREKTIALLKQYSVPKRKPRALKAETLGPHPPDSDKFHTASGLKAVGEGKPA